MGGTTRAIKKKTKDIYVLFNNNSGGDAADNAKQLMKMMNITYGEPKPEQLNFLNDNKQERHCTNRGMYSAFLYERGVTMLLSVWLIHQLLAS